MNPTPPVVSGTSNGAGQSANGAPAATPQANAAPTDFLALLAQIVGQPAEQVMTPIVATSNGLAAPEMEGDAETLDPETVEALGMLPISLPMFSSEAKLPMSMFSGSILGGAAAGVASGVQRGTVLDLKMLTEMIASEQAAARDGADGLDSFQLPSLDAAQSSKTTAASELFARPVQAPVGSSQWADEIGTRLTMMTEQGKSAASLRLSPEHLGPLEIRISMKDDQASVWFGAAHADTRAAIEHALPRLRELFEAQGLSLADAGVFHEAPREQPRETPSSPTLSSEPGALGVDEAAPMIRMSVGLFDAYA